MPENPSYLTKAQQKQLSRWQLWNKICFIVTFVALAIVLIFSSHLGLSSGREWGPLGLLIAVLVAPIIIMQFRLICPACGRRIGWQAKLQAPDQCRNCHIFLRAHSRT